MVRDVLRAWVVGGLAMLGPGVAAQPNYDEAAVPAYELPDPLVFADGRPVGSEADWVDERRDELLGLFREHMYGRAPGELNGVRFEVLESAGDALGGAATRLQVRVHFAGGDDGPGMGVLVYLPNHVDGPVPVFFGMNFSGNQTIHADPSIRLARGWVYNRPAAGITDHRAAEASRGARASYWAIEAALARGYGVATACYGDVDPDFDDGFRNGVHALFDGERDGGSGGSIAAWAWGYSRAMDYFEADDRIDATRVVAIGHSRLGKTALWAGATDERFAVVISNNSGCGGAALSRRRFGETVAMINEVIPHWFCASFHAYSGNEDALPVDQHMLLALIAPRPVYVASAVEDRWADPRGEYLACVHASPVYALFGYEGVTGPMPAVDAPMHGRIGYHVRRGGHAVTAYDWAQYLDFADLHLGDHTASP